MQRRKHTPEQIVRKLSEADRIVGEGTLMVDVCKRLEVSEQTYYRLESVRRYECRWRKAVEGVREGEP